MSPNQGAFCDYGNYYDLFYTAKGYLNETNYIISILKKQAPNAISLIELGSGTGNYSRCFSDAGYHITGIEKSESMIAQSQKKEIKNFTPVLGDMISFKLPQHFDAVISLFDVMCYLTKTDDLISCLTSTAQNLKSGGMLIFDSWYTPGVYTTPPVVSIKRAEDDNSYITRLAEPIINYQNNTVSVCYEFIIKNKLTLQCRTVNETHTLRHFSIPEVEYFARIAGFELVACEEMTTGKPLTNYSWKACYQLKKK